MTRKRPPSSIAVARLAGVSQSAVSRTFTPGGIASPATRAKVLAAAEALGYRPNLLSRSLTTGRSGIVAVAVGGLANPFHAMALESFAEGLQRTGRQVMLVVVADEWALGSAVELLSGYQVDAVLTSLSVNATDVAEALARFAVPIVTMNSAVTSRWVRTVAADDHGAGVAIAKHLHAQGARRFGYIAGRSGTLAQERREAGFRQGLAELGIAECARAQGDHHHGGGSAAVRALYASGTGPDGLFCLNDLTAMGAIDALREDFGLRCPEDVLVAGYDNVAASAWPPYRLTTVDVGLDRIAAQAFALMEAEEVEPSEVLVRPHLVTRASTRC
ncbi:LacI family DNA-binding transcriptional regulator [Methylobacterium sp. J-078]|uniref:LacI family DNA-binding transcriptional regulator n=1 Tax=Methylobacterium sp. J-078 TaxID=2836657 RepID=UPI001FBB2E28|nr:LacI family DNA-binding transcriptional regulator [Methylobacterium sp. J-078]MCJ2043093.1 LacI family DNA-binding transcriptional regulator [Methylobacterium sp. J-078]